jgi:D-amino-acid dehydrogenase
VSRTVVIGGGVIGLACAYALRAQGEEVTVLDALEPGAGCSKGNAGWIVPTLAEPLPTPGLGWTSMLWLLRRDSPLHIDPRAVARLAPWLWTFWRHCNTKDFRAGRQAWGLLADQVMESFDALVADGASFEMHRAGLLFAFLREATMRSTLHDFQGGALAAGSEPQPLTGAELRRFEPSLSDAVVAGLWVAQERHVRPESLCAGLERWLAARGVLIRNGATVTGGHLEGQTLRAVRTTLGDVPGDRFLVAAGARSGAVSEAIAGVSLPIQAGKGYSITVSTRHSPISRPLYLEEARLACTPFEDGYRFAGTMELSGINERLVTERISAIRRSAHRYLTLSVGDVTGVEWVGMRPLAPDGVPLLGALPGRPNVYVATGHGMLGVTTALTTGRMMADLLVRGRASVDLSPFDPARFAPR